MIARRANLRFIRCYALSLQAKDLGADGVYEF